MTTTISANIDKRLAKKLGSKAKKEQTTKSNIVSKALASNFEEKELIAEYNSRKPIVVKEVAAGEYVTLAELKITPSKNWVITYCHL